MAICDANLVDSMPKRLTAYGGLDALVHALESYVSVCATDYTRGKQQLYLTCLPVLLSAVHVQRYSVSTCSNVCCRFSVYMDSCVDWV